MSRELLEAAAKAAGFVLVWGDKYKVGDDEIDCTDIPYIRSGQPDEGDVYWNPLTDDGDALRLAAQLDMNVEVNICFVDVVWIDTDLSETHIVNSDWGAGDVPLRERMSHIRLAIVRAAAAMGEKPCD